MFVGSFLRWKNAKKLLLYTFEKISTNLKLQTGNIIIFEKLKE